MRIGGSLFVIALGAILKFAVTDQQAGGLNLGTVGVILMVVGVVGLILSFVLMGMRRRTEVINEPGAALFDNEGRPIGQRPARTTYVEPGDYDRR